MLAIDFKNVYMREHGYDMQCKLCDKHVRYEFSCSERGVNCICDDCREKLSEIFQVSPGEMMIKIQEGGKKIINDVPYKEDLFSKEVNNG